MLPDRAETLRSIAAALLLARGEPRGIGFFDVSFEAFWRSFAAPLLALPVYLLAAAVQYLQVGTPGGLGSFLAARALSGLIDVATFPVLAIFLTRFLDLGARYVPLVVATNWAAAPQVAAFAVAVLLAAALPPLGSMLLLLVMGGTLAYQWFVVRTALGTTAGNAAAAVVLGLLASFALDRLVGSLF